MYALLMLLFAPLIAAACLCPPLSFEEQIAKADVVLVGTVVSSKDMVAQEDRYFDPGPPVANVVVVTKVYKGRLKQDTVTIQSTTMNSSCGMRLRVGATYIVYCYRIRGGQVAGKTQHYLATGLCTRTRRASDTSEIAFLERYAAERE